MTNINDWSTPSHIEHGQKLVDAFMDLGEQMAKLKTAQSALREQLLQEENWGSPTQIDGTYGYVIISSSEKATTNWKGIATKLKASNQMIAGNTKTTEYTKVTGYSYNKKARVA
jgi:hypothetical protein